ncbi:MAG: pilin [Halioglobus sp.]|nr:pilin [Halioglobus sp.]
MKTRQKSERGFTLIELMIVIAIVGILAAIALPAYQDYIARSKMTEPLAALAEAKTTIAEYVATNGFPDDVTSFGINTAYRPGSEILVSLEMYPQSGSISPGESVYVGAEVFDAVWTGGTPEVGDPVSFFQLSGSTNADGTMTWECISGWGPNKETPVPTKYLPANCRG